ncbi:MAG: class I SAM-dependent methyltransferase [Proteobacteria bacterium]|nr:class I SAM-dependent methyltransferase [Pseudomonadota bacterium]
MNERTREEQYGIVFDVIKKHGRAQLGLMVNESWNQDPRRIVFTLARYKFVSKMLSGRKNVLEVGCADAFGTRLVQQEVGSITAVDYDPIFIEDAISRANPHWPMTCKLHDMLEGPVEGSFDGVYCLDVLEHITSKDETKFMANIVASMTRQGVAIFGLPSLESQVYASPQSKAGHVNCKSGGSLKEFLLMSFENVFMFSMNDEVIHTGYLPMAHYLMALCVGPKS